MSFLLNSFYIVLFILIAGICSGMETGGYQLNRIRLRYLSRHHDRAAGRLQKVFSDAHLFIFTVLIGHNVAVYLVSRHVTHLYLNAGVGAAHGGMVFGFLPWNAGTAATLTLMLPLFLFAEVIPKNVFRNRADLLMYRLSAGLLFMWRLLLPLTTLLKAFFNLLTGGRGRSEALSGISFSLQGLREYFSDETRCVVLSDHQHGMIDNLVSMHRVSVRELMKPITSEVSVSEDITVDEALNMLQKYDIEQLTVYRNSARQVTGFITLFDLLGAAVHPSDTLKQHVRKIPRISADLSLSSAFGRLRCTAGVPVAVTDRTSRVIGFIRLRDFAAYIVSSS